MDNPLCKSVYVVLILFQSFGSSKTFDMKDFDSNTNPIYPKLFCWLIFTFSYDKDIWAKST